MRRRNDSGGQLQRVALALLFLIPSTEPAASRTAQTCGWQVLRTRPPRAGEAPFTETVRLLREPTSANDVPGPDSLRFVVRRDQQHKPAIYLQRGTTEPGELLLARASGPRVSPNGRYLACIVWHSIQRPWNLVLLDLRSRKTSEPALDGCASPYSWSPDAKWLAVMVTPCQSPKSRLALVSIETGRVRWVDSLSVYADYEFGWSPDSRHLAVVRATAVDRESEDPTATELWVISDGGRHRCQLPVAAGYVFSEPKWINNSALQVDRARRGGGHERVVIELSEGRHP